MCYSQARTWGLRGTFSKLNFLRNLLLKFECGHKESVSNVDPFRTWRPKKQLDGWGERAWVRRNWKQRRDSIAADQASHLVDGRASRQQVFLRRMRVLEALSTLRHVQSPSTVITHQLSLSPATEDTNFCIVRLNFRGWHSHRITFVTVVNNASSVVVVMLIIDPQFDPHRIEWQSWIQLRNCQK